MPWIQYEIHTLRALASALLSLPGGIGSLLSSKSCLNGWPKAGQNAAWC
jgi:hypothetical protein